MTHSDSGHLASLKRRITAANAHVLSEIIGELMATGESIPEALVDTVAEKVEQGVPTVTSKIAQLVTTSRNRRLFTAARSALLADPWSLGILLRDNIPDSEVEKRLCDEFYEANKTNNLVMRRHALEALAESGSMRCIDDLKAVLYEMTPALQTAKVGKAAEGDIVLPGPLEELEAWTRREERNITIAFCEVLASSIRIIEQRRKQPCDDWRHGAMVDPFLRAREWKAEAKKHLAAQDFGASLNYSRKALEALLKIAIKELNLKVDKSEPIDRLLLPTLVAVIMSNLPEMDKDVRRAVKEVQDESTHGSHDQGDSPAIGLTAAIVEATIDRYELVESYFLQKVTARS